MDSLLSVTLRFARDQPESDQEVGAEDFVSPALEIKRGFMISLSSFVETAYSDASFYFFLTPHQMTTFHPSSSAKLNQCYRYKKEN